jgi:hypothetical protein
MLILIGATNVHNANDTSSIPVRTEFWVPRPVVDRRDANIRDMANLLPIPMPIAIPVVVTPTPVPVSTQAPEPIPLPTIILANEIEVLVCTYSWDCLTALNVMWCESGGKPNAIGGGTNYGLFQINQMWARKYSDFWTMWHVPEWNIAVAWDIYSSSSGWRPWGCRPY